MSNKFINPSGFAENLPAEQRLEDALKAKFATVARLYGYTHLETAAVEYMDTLASKGDINKEIYTIGRALGEGESAEADRGLRFDLTVPFARYVAQHQGELVFPYRRYQVQKVWRGERPQKGRFREFYQADVDVVAREHLPTVFDVEVLLVMARALSAFGIGNVTVHINNRKFLTGLALAYGATEASVPQVLQAIDKFDKIGAEEVTKLLAAAGLESTQATALLADITDSCKLTDFAAYIERLAVEHPLLAEGVNEFSELIELLLPHATIERVRFLINPRIARGLDYYTGLVVETTIDGHEKYGSICSGGRYADLASRFTSQKLPGVGLSIGLSRLLSIITAEKLLSDASVGGSDVVVGLLDEAQLAPALALAEALRESGLTVRSHFKAKTGLKKQLEQAVAEVIPHLVLAESDGSFTLFATDTGTKTTYATIEQLEAALCGHAHTSLLQRLRTAFSDLL